MRHRFSQKRMKKFVLFAFLLFTANKQKHSFVFGNWENLWRNNPAFGFIILTFTYKCFNQSQHRLIQNSVLIVRKNMQKVEISISIALRQTVVKFVYSEKATKFCEIFPLLLTVCTAVKSKGKILQIFVAFLKYMNFKDLTNTV